MHTDGTMFATPSRAAGEFVDNHHAKVHNTLPVAGSATAPEIVLRMLNCY